MGYLPKHIKVRRHKWNMRIIANAALAGATFYSSPRSLIEWSVRYPDGKESHYYRTKAEAAATYLRWWFDKQGMWPKRRIA